MWKVECEINSQLRVELEENQKLLDEAAIVIEYLSTNTTQELEMKNNFLSKLNKREG